jgi:PAS domain S-box-containing protein
MGGDGDDHAAPSDARFRALVENGVDCITLVDGTGVFSYVSPAVGRALGCDHASLVGTRAIDLVHPDDLAQALAARDAGPGESVEGTFRVRHRDGSWRWFAGTSTNLLHDPAVRAVVSNRRDVTERRAVEERLRFDAAVLAQVSEAVIAADPDARIIYWNAAAERLYGWTAAEAIGQPGGELLKHEWVDTGDAARHREALMTKGAWRGEMIHATKSGERLRLEASIRLLRDENGRAIAGINVMTDPTAQRRLEEQLRQSQKMEAIGVFAGGVAHDFNNLLSVIVGCTELPLSRLPPDHPDAAALRDVLAAAQRGAELTRKLLAFSRKQVFRLASLDLNATVRDVTKLLGRIVGEDVELAVALAPETLPVRADSAQVEQVLFNLATNARQAMPGGGRLGISAQRVRLDAAFVERNPWARPGAFAELTVVDTGVGMDEATLRRAFEPFFSTKTQGTGLGLATVYGIVRQHDGFVHVESAPGRGASFRVFLPLEGASVVSGASVAPEPIAPGGDETILVAEDAEPLRALVTSTLTGLGYRVIPAVDGEEAVRAFVRHRFEIGLVMMDVVMPRVGAIEAYERMRAIDPGVKVLFTTGYSPEATELSRLVDEAGIQLLAKPFTSRALGLSVRRALDRPRG